MSLFKPIWWAQIPMDNPDSHLLLSVSPLGLPSHFDPGCAGLFVLYQIKQAHCSFHAFFVCPYGIDFSQLGFPLER